MTISLSSFPPSTAMSEKRDTSSPPPGSGFNSLCKTVEYSPTPGADLSSHSGSPGSASDHMGNLNDQQQEQPLFPGSSSIAAIGVGSHVNRVINTTTQQQQPEKSEGSTSTGNRRQKRLQRNRESARLSRRRRKQYLEVLEERVDKFSNDLDKNRREHVAQAVTTISQQRVQLLRSPHPPADALVALNNRLSRTSVELMVTTTFQAQQLKSFATPSATKFVLWLTLQTDTYFRGGRAASERLSAARIGERMLTSGTKRAGPSQSMWPLLCNEIGLSYDQEERVRSFQKLLIQNPKSWVDRHTTHAAGKVIQSNHDAVQALTLRLGQREKSSLGVLSENQQLKLLAWSMHNRDRVAHSTANVVPANATSMRVTSNQQHVAANLYILNERLQNVLQKVPRAAPLVTGIKLKKLSRRACFESLGATDEKGNAVGLSRENSFASSGSLKRSASEMSIEGEEKAHVPQISPVEAQATVAPVVEQALSYVRDLLPPPPDATLTAVAVTSAAPSTIIPFQNVPMPIPVSSFAYQAPAPVARSHPNFSTMVGEPIAPYPTTEAPSVESSHTRKSSFLPDHLKVVPEEMWPADEADEFLLDMIEGDWAIGEGIDMDLQE